MPIAEPTARGLLDRWFASSACPRVGAALARVDGADVLWIDDSAPEAVARVIRGAHEAAQARATESPDPDASPASLAACERVVRALGWRVREPTLVYAIAPDVRFAAPATVTIARSDQAQPGWLRDANPGNWEPVEWRELLDGRLGPWTMAVEAGRVRSICHTPRAMTARAAECGVWTAPSDRGRGLAAATTAVWVDLVKRPDRDLFYCTSASNRSSQRVAARLRLPLLGRVWRLAPPDATAGANVHPLSSLRTS